MSASYAKLMLMSSDGDVSGGGGLVDLLIRHGRLPAAWRDSPALRDCLGQLTGLGAAQLRAEPRRLAQRHAELAREAQETAARNYSVFIRSAEATRAMSAELSRVEATVESLLSDRLPRLAGRCTAFTESVGQLASRRRRVQLGLQRHAQVLEVLEIPQLLDTCVRNDYWEEALELVSYAKRLERGRGLLEAQVVAGVLEEVRRVSEQMLAQVAGRLRSGRLQLPDCLRLLGYLRRLAAYPEPLLRLHFLAARDAYLCAQLAAVPDDDPYLHARQTAEDTRMRDECDAEIGVAEIGDKEWTTLLFDTVTHYRAAFADQDPLLSSADGPASESGLLHCWLAHRVSLFLECLERDLGRGAGANGRLESLLSCCMYFGASLAKIGADFRPHLLDQFGRAAMTQLRVATETALKHFHSAVYSYALALPAASAGAPAVSAPWDFGARDEEPPGSGARSFGSDEIAAPADLVNYPPLAVLLNGLLAGLNELRPCMSVCLAPQLCEAATELMRRAVSVLAGWYSGDTGALTPAERQGFALCCGAFKRRLLPHVNRCLAAMCDRELAAAYLGLTATQRAAELREFGCLDAEAVCEPLRAFLGPEEAEEPSPDAADHVDDVIDQPMPPPSDPEPVTTLDASEQKVATPCGNVLAPSDTISPEAAPPIGELDANDQLAAAVAAEADVPVRSSGSERESDDSGGDAADVDADGRRKSVDRHVTFSLP